MWFISGTNPRMPFVGVEKPSSVLNKWLYKVYRLLARFKTMVLSRQMHVEELSMVSHIQWMILPNISIAIKPFHYDSVKILRRIVQNFEQVFILQWRSHHFDKFWYKARKVKTDFFIHEFFERELFFCNGTIKKYNYFSFALFCFHVIIVIVIISAGRLLTGYR